MVTTPVSGTGPIYLESLSCSGSESTILDCQLFSTLGVTTCDHSEDVGVKCIGMSVNMLLIP